MKQSEIMMESEGDAWFLRNRDDLGKTDLVSSLIEANGIVPKSVLEVGCANGWRLLKLREKYGCEVRGLDPSIKALLGCPVPAYQGTAEALPFDTGQFDLVIYGFCLYLSDPQDWHRIAAEGDRVLAPHGHIVIHDFETFPCFARPYEHRKGVLSYHFDFARLWRSSSLYKQVSRNLIDDGSVVTILRKNPVTSIQVFP